MEHLATKLAHYILEKGIITEDLIEIYQYGFQCFLELSVSTIETVKNLVSINKKYFLI